MNSKSVWLEDSNYLLYVEVKPVGDGSVTDLVCKWYRWNAVDVRFDFASKKVSSQAMHFSSTEVHACSKAIVDSGLGVARPYFCLTTTKVSKNGQPSSFVTLHTTSVADDAMDDFKILTLANANCESPTVEAFSFLDGPMLTWKGDRYLFFLSRIHGGKFNLTQVRLKKMVKDYVTDPENVQLLEICSSKPPSCLVLFVCRQDAEFIFFDVNCSDSKVTSQEPPVPNKFAGNVKSVELYIQHGELCALLTNRDNEVFYFVNRKVKKRLKFNSCPTFRFLHRHLVVSTEEEVKVHDRESLNSISNFPACPTVIGDFVSRGTDQLLLLAAKPANQNPVQKFVLTDFGLLYFDTSEEATESVSKSVDDSMRTFAGAVRGRLHASLQWLDRTENELSRKIQHVRSTCQRVNTMASGNRGDTPKQSLVPFIVSKTGSISQEPTPENPSLEVMRTWQLYLLGKLCIGVELKAREEIRALSVAVIPNEFFTNTCCESRSTKGRDGHWLVVCAIEAPPMSRSEIPCDLVLNYLIGDLYRSTICERIVLKSTQIMHMMNDEFNLTLSDDKVQRALSVLQQTKKLRIQSGRLAEEGSAIRLLENLGFSNLIGCHGNGLFSQSLTGALAAASVRLLSWKPGTAILEVSFKDRAQLLLVVHALYDALDELTTILVHNGETKHNAMETDSVSDNEDVLNDSDVMIFDDP